MNSFQEIRQTLQHHRAELEEEYKVKDIGVFGSYIRGEQDKSSDIDILVEFRAPVGFFKFLELEDYLGRLLGVKVDLVSRKALKPRIGKQIMDEVVTL
jgi:uncharacterized protein